MMVNTFTKLILVKPALDGDLDDVQYVTGVYADSLVGLCKFVRKFQDNPMKLWDIWTDYGSEQCRKSSSQEQIMEVAEAKNCNLITYNTWYEAWMVLPVRGTYQSLRSYISKHDTDDTDGLPEIHENISLECPMCHRVCTINFNSKEWRAYSAWKKSIVKVQDAFPNWKPFEREFLQTGLCPDCQKALFQTVVTTSTRLRYK